MGLHWQFGVVQNAVASVTAGITTSIVSDDDSDGDLLGASSNFMSDGEILQVQYSGSGDSVTYTVTKSGASGLSLELSVMYRLGTQWNVWRIKVIQI